MMVAQENNITILIDIIHVDGWQWWNFGFGGPILENVLFKLCATCHNTDSHNSFIIEWIEIEYLFTSININNNNISFH